jgi:hypothetical protein
MDPNELMQRVRERAFAIWQREGEPAGRDVEHWLMAEMELAGEGAIAPARRPANGSNGASKVPAKRTAKIPAATKTTSRAKASPRP